MTRGHPPLVAIDEAKLKAAIRGSVILVVHAEHRLPFDFVTCEGGCITLVRVRRLRYAQYTVADIGIYCAREIQELRDLRIPEGIFCELHVRGPDRHWHRYLVLPQSIELLEDVIPEIPVEGEEELPP